MKKSDIFKRILAVVSDICECTPEQICSPAKPQRLVDARSIAVHFLHAAGLHLTRFQITPMNATTRLHAQMDRNANPNQ